MGPRRASRLVTQLNNNCGPDPYGVTVVYPDSHGLIGTP